jgi:hypothetical protein
MTQEIFAEWFHNFFAPGVKNHLAKLSLLTAVQLTKVFDI